MKKLLQINSVVSTGSTGNIAELLGCKAIENNWKSYIAYGRERNKSNSQLIKIGSSLDQYAHGLKTRLVDRHGFGSKRATKKFIKKLDAINPDVIGLHNIHGYYIHVGILFEYLKKIGTPVIWTLHDCWPYTGHCIYYTTAGCEKWKYHCDNCPLTHTYPKSLGVDNSFKNFDDKKRTFSGHPDLTIVTPSKWLKKEVKHSFLQNYRIKVIYNGIDLNQFNILESSNLKNEYVSLKGKKILLGVANVWDERKGLLDFIKLNNKLDEEYQIVLIGLNKKQIRELPKDIIGITRTESVSELIEWYNYADIFINPSKEETFGMVTAEAMACGTPVIGYDVTATTELIDNATGKRVPAGDINLLKRAIISINKEDFVDYSEKCRTHAIKYFDQDRFLSDYFNLYQQVINR